MKVLVTGATGFLGSRLAGWLTRLGYSVTVLARPTSDRRRLVGLDIEFATGDVTDRTSVRDATRGVDVVYHCAAMLEFGSASPERLVRVNVEGTRNVLEEAVDAGAVAVHVSSVAALGPTGPDPVDETHWSIRDPVVTYERTKRDGHLVARALASCGAPVRIAIPGGVYGHGDEGSMATLIETFVSYPTPLGYLPDMVQSLVNVDDCAQAVALIGEIGRDGEEYLLCADAVPFREWFELIAAGAGRRAPFAYVPTRVVRWSSRPASTVARWLGANPVMLTETIEIATRHQAFSGQKARRELGWSPRSLRQGMTEMCGAIRRDNDRRRTARRRGVRVPER